MTGKDHSLPRKLIQIRRRKLLLSIAPILPKHPEITGAQVVAQDENDIGPGSCLGLGRRDNGQQRDKQAKGKRDSNFHRKSLISDSCHFSCSPFPLPTGRAGP